MSIRYNIIAGLGIKDEEWIIDKTLSALNKFCSKIIIVDDGSTDNTENICKSYNKVEWYVRKKHNWRVREEAKQRQEIIDYIKPHNPDYVLFLDADEIPSPNIINFINNIDTSINLWKFPWIHLWKDDKHYRIDSYKTDTGVHIMWDPFNGAQRKYFLMKFDKNINYEYPLEVMAGGCGKNHMAPLNVPLPHSTIENVVIIHYGKISEYFKTGNKDNDYAVMRCFTNKHMNLQERIKHHKLCRSEKTLKLERVNNEWFWD
jgi:glycosyltransferase involved in cell wall biosynthesis